MTIKELAKRIAEDLFQDGSAKKVVRLRCEFEHKEQGGGYCKEAVVSTIEKHLKENLFWKLE